MESLRELYRIGRGPSSSHTMGPTYAASRVRRENPDATRFEATLFGSLAKTGRGHLTDAAIRDGDVISVRGKGKGTVTGTGGRSRKDRIFVTAERRV